MSLRLSLGTMLIAVFAASSSSADLPTGARLRLGNDQLAFRFPPSFALLPPDYKTVLIPEGGAGGVRKLDLATGRPLEKTEKNAIGGQVVLSGDGKRVLVTATGIQQVRETATDKVIRDLRPPNGFNTIFVGGMPASSLSGDGKVLAHGGQSSGGKGSVIVWEVDTGNELAMINSNITGPSIPLLAPSGKVVAIRAVNFGFTPPGKAADNDVNRSILVWDIEKNKEMFRAKPSDSTLMISTIVFSPDSSLMAAASPNGTIDLWSVKDGKGRPPLLGRTGQGVRVAFSPDGKTLGAVAQDGSIQRWSLAEGKLLDTFEGPPDIPVVQGLSFASNDRLVAWGTIGQRLLVWEAPSGKILSPPYEHTGGIKSIAFAAQGKEILTTGMDGRAFRWDAATGKVIAPIEIRPARTLGLTQRPLLALSPDATRAVAIGPPTAVFDLASGKEEFCISRAQRVNSTTTAIPSVDLSKVVLLSIPFDQKMTGSCSVWDLTARQKIAEMDVHMSSRAVPAAAVTPSGNRLVTASISFTMTGQPLLTVTGWDLKTGKKLEEVEDTNAFGSVSVAAASESYAVVMYGSGRIRLFDFESGRGGDEIEKPRMRSDGTGPVVFSPDRKMFAAMFSPDDPAFVGVRVYEWPSGNVLHTFLGHRAPISALTFSPDGKTLASGAMDTSVLLWDLTKTAKE